MKDSILSATLTSCTVFACLTLPLAASGSNSVAIEFQNEQIFTGKLRDIALPYLGIAAVVSLGAGAANLSMREWSSSSKRSAQAHKQLSQLQTELQQKDKQIEELQLTDSFLEVSGLNSFLAPDRELSAASQETEHASVAARAEAIAAKTAHAVARPVEFQVKELPQIPVLRQEPATASSSVEVVKPAKPRPQPVRPQPEELPRVPILRSESNGARVSTEITRLEELAARESQQVSHAPVAKPIHSVASFSTSSLGNSQIQQQSNKPVAIVMAEVNDLQTQLRQMAARMEALQSSLQDSVESLPSYIPDSSSQVIEHLHRRLQLLESNWVEQRPAS
jgi:peptidoglycan hydrolase CwlO-like protein